MNNNYFYKMAQQQLSSEHNVGSFSSSEPLPTVSRAIANGSLSQERHQFEREIQKGGDLTQQPSYQERDYITKASLEEATHKLMMLRQETMLLLQKEIHDVQKIKAQYQQYLQAFQELKTEHQQLIQSNYTLQKELQIARQQIELLRQATESKGNTGRQSIPIPHTHLSTLVVQENQNMSSITIPSNENSSKNISAQPFAYSPVNNLLYSRSNPPPLPISPNSQNNNARTENLEKKVAELSGELIEIKKHLQQMYQIINSRAVPSSQQGYGNSLQGFVNS